MTGLNSTASNLKKIVWGGNFETAVALLLKIKVNTKTADVASFGNVNLRKSFIILFLGFSRLIIK
ncbi:MAG: hypothetical protein GXP44_01570 [bacterium]|nr:hypothetical protein [bacterium]